MITSVCGKLQTSSIFQRLLQLNVPGEYHFNVVNTASMSYTLSVSIPKKVWPEAWQGHPWLDKFTRVE